MLFSFLVLLLSHSPILDFRPLSLGIFPSVLLGKKPKILRSTNITFDQLSTRKSLSLCWNNINFKEMEKALLSPIKKKIPINDYLNIKASPYNPTVFILFLKNGLKAVFKPDRPVDEINSALMAYRFSQFMQWKFVPPTIIRTIDGKKGAVQLFVEGLDGTKYDPKKYLTRLQKSDIFTFYFVTGNFSSRRSHFVFGKHCKEPAIIDNDQMMNDVFIQYGDYPFLRHEIKDLNFSLSNPKEYGQFPLNQVQSVDAEALIGLNKSQFVEKMRGIFTDMEDFNKSYLYKWYNLLIEQGYLDGNFDFVKWRNSYWIKVNFSFFVSHKDFVPSLFSKQTISKLKALNSSIINSFLPHMSVRRETVMGILYRKNVILKESFKAGRSRKN